MNENPNPQDPSDPAATSGGPTGGTATDQQERRTPSPPPRQLRRRTDQEVIGGVAAGIGEYLRIDPVIVRIAFVIAAFASGAGVIAYLIGWFLIPDQDGRAEIGGTTDPDDIRETPPWVWVALAVGAVVVLGGFSVQRGPSLLIAAALVGLGVFLVHRDSEEQRATRSGDASAWEPTGGPAGSAGSAASSGSWGAAQDRPAGTWGSWSDNRPWGGDEEARAAKAAARAQAAARAEAAKRSPLRRLTLGLAVGSVAIMAALTSAGTADLAFVAWTAVPLAIIGGGLVIGSLRGGARGLIGWGVTLTIALAISLGGVSLVPSGTDISGGTAMAIGELSERPTSGADVDAFYGLAIGSVDVDLRRVDPDDLAGRSLTVNAGIGQITVLVPEDVPLDVTGTVGVGSTNLLGLERGGVPSRQSFDDEDPDALRLDLRAGIGEVVVRRAP